MKIEMTEIQKAYLIGREDAFSGGVGTHLYIELLYDGELHKFNRALNKVIESQPFLRAKISDPYCFEIQGFQPYEIEVLEVEKNNQEVIQVLRKEFSHKKYTKDDFPLFTVKALGLKNKYRIAFSIDLIIADGMSLYELIAEINCYLDNPEQAITDYSKDLEFMMDYYHQSKKTKHYEKAKKHYLNSLDSLYEAPKLNYVTGNENDVDFLHKEFQLNSKAYAMLKEKAAEKGFSATDILLGIYAMVLEKWSQNPEMSINVTTFKRPDGDNYRHVIGDFTTSMLVQSAYDSKKTFEENVKQLKLKLFTAMRYQDFEVTEILKELEHIGRPSVMPVVFTSMLFEEDTLLGNNFKKDYIISQTPQVYLDFQAKNSTGTLVVTWDYRKNKFLPEMIDSMFTEYCSCLEYYILKQDDLYHNYSMRTKEGVEKKYRLFNAQTREQQWSSKTLLAYYNETVSKMPEHVFAVINGESFTFAQVKKKAEQLAIKVDDAKAKSEKKRTRIVFLGGKSLNSLVCIVAAQMTGDSFCAMNEYFGNEKRKEVLESIKNYIYIEDFAVKEVSASTQEIEEDESYILFTSGTTGKPKGIIITESAALNTVHAIIQMYQVSERDVCANISNLYFDLSIFDLFASMITGMKIYMVDVYKMNWFLNGELYRDVTIWNSTPALGREFLLNYSFDSIRCVLVSGDFVQKKLVEDIYGKYGMELKITALGGATEASIWSNHYNCADYKDKKCIPYGIPLANQQMYVAKASGMLAETGVLGEILISGDGLAVGYLDDQQTKEAFVWNEMLEKRIYKTGDLGYLGMDQNIYIVGRVVNEIKHNGYRIDLREIEKYINRVDGVKNSFVFIDKMDDGRTRLLCAVISMEEEIEKKIRRKLAGKLPHYMMPAHFLVSDTIPLTSNGKINVSEIVRILNEKGVSYTFSEMEREVIGVCRSVIEEKKFKEPEDGNDTFFDMGGQSLQVVTLKEALDAHFKTDVSLQDLMSNGSIAGLSDLIQPSQKEKKELSNQLILLRKGTDVNRNIVFIHAGSGEVNIYLKLSQHIQEEYNIYGVRYVPDERQLAMYEYDFRKIAKWYCQLLSGLSQVDYLGGWCIGGTISYEMSILEPEKYKHIFLLNSMAPVKQKSIQMEDSFESEVTFLKEFLTTEMIVASEKNVTKLWTIIADLIDQNEEYRKSVLAFIPDILMRLLPNTSNLSGRQLVYFINMFRSSENARYKYQSNQHTDAECFCFYAEEEPAERYEEWKEYVSKFECYGVSGNHVTMFEEEHICDLAGKFDKIVKF